MKLGAGPAHATSRRPRLRGGSLATVVLVALLCAGLPAQASRPRFSPLPAHVHGRVLAVPHHHQSTRVWCWAASIAMVAEYLKKTPVSDCDVASRLSRAQGGDGVCCNAEGRPIDRTCYHGQRTRTMTEIMNWYFNLTATEFHRPLTWDELKTSIDAGYPVVARLWWGGRMGHAIVIKGYAEPDLVLVDDPARRGDGKLMGAPYGRLVGPRGIWVGSWYLRRDETAGYLSGGGPTLPPLPAPRVTGPARSTVSAAMPRLAATVAPRVLARIDRQLPRLGACYDAAIEHGQPAPSPATLLLSFAIQDGTPQWIVERRDGGLPRAISDCVTQTVAGWEHVFPRGPDYGDTQDLALTFRQLPAPALTAGGPTKP